MEPPPSGSIRKDGIAIIGTFESWPWGQHPDEGYLADALESIGIRVYRVNQKVNAPVSAPQNCWALFTGHEESRGKLAQWSRTHPTILWTLDWLPDFEDRLPVINMARHVTLFISSDRYDWLSRGVKRHAYLPGACENVEFLFNPKPKVICAFIGSLYTERRHRIAAIVKSFGGTVLAAPHTWLYGVKLANFLNSAKILIGDNYVNHCPGYWSSRNYIVPGLGGFLLTPRVPGLEKDLTDGVHAVFYDNVEQLPQLIERWSKDDEKRETIREAGTVHVIHNHNWQMRAKALVAILEKTSDRRSK